ncbi:MAG: hypothetical protein R3E98_19395 [Gemmatimonadota bacterium]|nr:hypothetical protein [Gemmatimonadota bacterium]
MRVPGSEEWIRAGVAAALLGTLGLGVWLRWALAGGLALPLDFAHLRHAHSHLGYYGILLPLAWRAWRRAGAPVPSGRTGVLYAVATSVAVVGFLRAGYGPEAIAGSTVVGAVWLTSAARLRARTWAARDLLAPVLPAVVAALACVPMIALRLDSDPATAYAFVATFLAILLLGVAVPSALLAQGATVRHAPAWGVTALLGAAALGAWPAAPARAALLAYGLGLAAAARTASGEAWLRAAWFLVAAGLSGMALGVLPDTHPVVIGAIHFLVLGPVLGGLALSGRGVPGSRGGWLYLGAVGVLTLPLVLQGLGAGAWTRTVSAWGGTLVLASWTAMLLVPGGPLTRDSSDPASTARAARPDLLPESDP